MKLLSVITGTVALLQCIFPTATPVEIAYAVTRAHASSRPTVVPPLLDAWAAYELLRATHREKTTP